MGIIDGEWNFIDEWSFALLWNSTDEWIISPSILKDIPVNLTSTYDRYYIRKMVAGNTQNRYMVFIRRAWYRWEEVLWTIWRLILFNIFLLFPAYFGARFFVRKTLKPVRENFDAMNHFIEDAWHELKTPLTILAGDLSILENEWILDITLIKNGIKTIKNMRNSIDSLIELSNITLPGDLWSIDDIESAINDELAAYKKNIEEKNISVDIKISSSSIPIDPKHFSLLIGNLLKNAILYNVTNGSISISIEKDAIIVADTGIGIDKKNIDRIWGRFYREDRTGKYVGSGIGLSIVDRIVKLYGWNIQVDSQKWKGTRFTINI
jgi:two-component system OmpR family sensor kinase